MSFINYSSREINCKIVYYGPGLCGKTTNLQYIYNKTNPEAKGKMISLATETERTLFFDFLPLSLGEIRGFRTRFHLYTVPGQVFYDASRKLILKGVDGVVFVADSQVERMEANIESLDNLRINLKEQGYDLDKVPFVMQYNKRDLPNAVPVEELRKVLNPRNVTERQAVAPTGVGFFHWTVVNLPKETTGLAANASATGLPAGALQAYTDFGASKYGGACPPPGPAHRYVFTVYALKVEQLDVGDDRDKAICAVLDRDRHRGFSGEAARIFVGEPSPMAYIARQDVEFERAQGPA